MHWKWRRHFIELLSELKTHFKVLVVSQSALALLKYSPQLPSYVRIENSWSVESWSSSPAQTFKFAAKILLLFHSPSIKVRRVCGKFPFGSRDAKEKYHQSSAWCKNLSVQFTDCTFQQLHDRTRAKIVSHRLSYHSKSLMKPKIKHGWREDEIWRKKQIKNKQKNNHNQNGNWTASLLTLLWAQTKTLNNLKGLRSIPLTLLEWHHTARVLFEEEH